MLPADDSATPQSTLQMKFAQTHLVSQLIEKKSEREKRQEWGLIRHTCGGLEMLAESIAAAVSTGMGDV